MSSCFVKLFYALVLLLSNAAGSILSAEIKCIESERQALLNFKQSLFDDYGILSTWSEYDNDCCKWRGIQCHNETGHILLLDLQELIGSFTNLTYLNLSYSLFGGSIPCDLGKLTHLQYLDLSINDLNGEIPYQLGNISQLSLNLQELYLSYNNMTSSVFQDGFNFGSKLQNLNLQNCKGPIPDGFGKVMNSLETLHLYDNKLQGKIPSFFRNMCRLQILDLSYNKLNGEISSFFENSSWCNQHIFQSLYLSSNQIIGVLPKSIGLLSELKDLNLEGNYLEGEVNESHLSNFSKLETLYLSGNSLSLKFVPSWVPPFQLKYLGLRSCKSGPSFPSWLQTQRSLTFLDISDNAINDSVPKWFWGKLQSMETLNISHNNLTELPNCWKSVESLLILDLSNNKLSGKIPMSMGTLVKLKALVLANNNLTGELPSTLKNCSNLIMLDVGENMLSGPIPPWIGESMQLLIILNMRGNHFSGNLPIHLCYLKHIQLLDLSRNYMSGGIPTCLKNFTAMAENSINRKIGNLSSLDYLDLSRNHFSGRIPSSLSQIDGLGKLDLSHNSLSGRIPTGRDFETYDASSFEGNVDLCGEQINKTCPGDGDRTTTMKPEEEAEKGEDSDFYEALYMSMGVGYFTGFWGLFGPILVWRPWRNAYLMFLNRFIGYMYVWLRTLW
uniref:LRR receptor-like serine/threonine-protein kinase At3g47570 family n=1 Tax=Cajanus cajan TaxID=3821 RepID=A0A151R9U8_CAJCA|nr:putative LRR receptor-like serine/threonine-protein kinase At3g47570 family [Cajanus cajan]